MPIRNGAKMYKNFFCCIVALPIISYCAQPPLPPKPPAQIKPSAALDTVILPSPWEPIAPMLAYFQTKTKKGSKTIYSGIVKKNAQGGMLKCEITHDLHNDSYYGELVNDRFTAADWTSTPLDARKAKEYYDNLREQSEKNKLT